MSFIVIALASLLINNFIYYHSEFLMKYFDADDYKLGKLYNVTSLLPFVMLIMFIIYMVWFR